MPPFPLPTVATNPKQNGFVIRLLMYWADAQVPSNAPSYELARKCSQLKEKKQILIEQNKNKPTAWLKLVQRPDGPFSNASDGASRLSISIGREIGSAHPVNCGAASVQAVAGRVQVDGGPWL
jgi:hypothetical protein